MSVPTKFKSDELPEAERNRIAARMAIGETNQAQKLARAALAAQPDLSGKYVRDQEWYRDGAVRKKLVQRLIEAGVSEPVLLPR